MMRISEPQHWTNLGLVERVWMNKWLFLRHDCEKYAARLS
jgi:hypothetical protein